MPIPPLVGPYVSHPPYLRISHCRFPPVLYLERPPKSPVCINFMSLGPHHQSPWTLPFDSLHIAMMRTEDTGPALSFGLWLNTLLCMLIYLRVIYYAAYVPGYIIMPACPAPRVLPD